LTVKFAGALNSPTSDLGLEQANSASADSAATNAINNNLTFFTELAPYTVDLL
jgi:hypothetical protein